MTDAGGHTPRPFRVPQPVRAFIVTLALGPRAAASRTFADGAGKPSEEAPKLSRDADRIDPNLGSPRCLIAGAVKLAVMHPAERDREFVAHLSTAIQV